MILEGPEKRVQKVKLSNTGSTLGTNFRDTFADLFRQFLREALLTFVHGFELMFPPSSVLRIIIDFCEGTMHPRHSVLSTGSLKS